jgi:ABC-type sugar transport system permease subunit
VDLLGSPDTAMLGVVVANVWRTFPYAMILTLAALQTIPAELYEAAKIDGAGRWNLFRFVTFPMIQNTFLIATIILSIHYFNMIELPLVLTGGGPVNRTELLGLRVYREAFVLFKYGFGSAVAMLMFVVNIVVSLIYIRILRAESRD